MTTNRLELTLASGESLDVRDFAVEEGLSQLFEVRITAVGSSVDVDFEAAVGAHARFEIQLSSPLGETRYWSGICARAEQIAVEEAGLSTYAIRIVPELWLLSQRRNYRVFQDKSELDIVLEVLQEWGIEPSLDLDVESYGKRRMRVQYAESDLDFVSRLLEDIGVTYYFDQIGETTKLVLADAPSRREAQASVRFVAEPSERVDFEYVTHVRTHREVRPGRYTQSDVDYRKALNYPLAASASRGSTVEGKLERYHHNYGSFLWKGQGGGTPVADDRGAARTSEREGGKQVDKRLEAQRVDARAASFQTTAHHLRPGRVIRISGHPRSEVGAPLLVVKSHLSGHALREWSHACETRYTDVNYRPPLRTPKPRTHGVESATVTGPAGEEIHTDEFGRVRVHFHWDREGASDETSSCWVPVSQAWAGAGFGAISLPRVGQEVLVDFLGADPDRPLVMGRVFTTTTPPPYELPQYKMVSGMRSESYPRPSASGGQARMGGGPLAPPPSASDPPALLRGPAGGGAPIEMLGGGEPAPAAVAPAPGAGGGGQVQPGVFGGLQARPDELNGAVDRMRSLGPDRRDHRRSANGVVTDDRAGNERLYLQGQNDLFIAAKRNLTASVGANRAFMILGNDYEEIPAGYQATKVGKDRTVEVAGKQRHLVLDDIVVQGENNHITVTKNNYYSETKDGGQAFQAKAGIMLRVGTTAAIIMTPTAIVIDAPKVYINPGKEIMDAIYSGVTPEQAAADKAREDRINAAAAQLAENMRQTGRANNATTREALRAAMNGERRGRGITDTLGQYGTTDPAEAAEAARRTEQILGPVQTNRPVPAR
jgi:type VI secretion system secreted protein VgrG